MKKKLEKDNVLLFGIIMLQVKFFTEFYTDYRIANVSFLMWLTSLQESLI